MAAVALGSPLISLWAFGNTSYTLAFAALSVWLLFAILTNGEWAVMRGYDRLKQLGKSIAVVGTHSHSGTVPLLYFLRIDGHSAHTPCVLRRDLPVHHLIQGERHTQSTDKPPRCMARRQRHDATGRLHDDEQHRDAVFASNILVIYLNRAMAKTP